MNKIFIPLILLNLFILVAAPAQEQLAVDWSNRCRFDGGNILPENLDIFPADSKANQAIQSILNPFGLSSRSFQVNAADIDHISAIIQENNRYILHSEDFFYGLSPANQEQYWWKLGILAHETGHHVQGHILSDANKRASLELEADKWAGFALYNLGATLEQAQLALKKEAPEFRTSTHPSRTARLEAVAVGYRTAKEKSPRPVDPIDNSQSEFNLPPTDEELRNSEEYGTPPPLSYEELGPTVVGNMVLVKGGTFQMGSKADKDSQPIHTVTLSDFYMAKTEVAFEEYDRFCEAVGKRPPDDEGWRREDNPVINVSWFDAVEYCNWKSALDGYTPVYTIYDDDVEADWTADGYRLPTEAEWEYAARSRGKADNWAGTSSKKEVASYANTYERKKRDRDGYEYTAPVGSFSPNALGIYDLSGNVMEWCWDWYSESYYAEFNNITDPKGPTVSQGVATYKTTRTGFSGQVKNHGKICRGGSWYHFSNVATCYIRNLIPPNKGESINFIGFRLVRNATQ